MKSGRKIPGNILGLCFSTKPIITGLLVTMFLLPACAGPPPEADAGPSPEANFSASAISGQVPLRIEFSNSSLNADWFQWDFGDGSKTTSGTVGEKVTHHYTKAGTYLVTLTAIKEGEQPETGSASLTITVDPGALSKVIIRPRIEISAGNTQQLEATITDQFDNQVTEVDVSWTITDGDAVSITQAGILSAGEVVGTFTDIVRVEVIQDGLVRTATASIVITPGPLDQLVVDFDSVEIGTEMKHRFMAVGSDRYGNRISGLYFRWSVQNGGGTIDSNGLFTAGTTAGTYDDTIKVETTDGDITRSATIDVTVLNSSAWKRMISGTTNTLRSVWGSSSSDIFAVGDGTILRYNDNSWRQMDIPPGVSLHAVWGSSSSDIFAVGLNGVILHYDGHNWSQMDSGSAESLDGVWGSSSSDVFAVGDQGTILHYDGNNWSLMYFKESTTFYDVWGSSSSDVISAGDGLYRNIWHYDGDTWRMGIIDINAGRIFAIWGTSPSDAFAAGYPGAIWHYNGTSWIMMTDYFVSPRETLYGIWGSSSSNVFAVGESGTILHYDVYTWSPMTSGTTETLLGVWVSPDGDVFVVGQSGIILYYHTQP